MVIAFKCKSRRSISLERRDFEALNAHDRLSLRQQAKKIEYLMAILPLVRKRRIIRKCIIESLIMEYIDAALKIVYRRSSRSGATVKLYAYEFFINE